MGVDMNKVRARRLEHKKMEEDSKGKKSFLELRQGDNKIRILPPWSPENAWCKTIPYHQNIKQKAPVVCLKEAFSQPCPACEVVKELFSTKNQEDREYAFSIKAKNRFFANVLDLDKNDGKVYVFAFGVQVEKQIIAIMDPGASEEKAGGDVFGYGDITDQTSGRNLIINKVVPADKKQTSYQVTPSLVPSPVPNWDVVKAQLNNLDTLVAKDTITYETMSALITNGGNQAEPTVVPDNEVEVNPAAEFAKPGAIAAAQAAHKGVDEFGRPLAVMAPVQAPAVASTVLPSAPAAPMVKPDLSKTLAALRAQRGSVTGK